MFFVTPPFYRFFYLTIVVYRLYALGHHLGVLSFLFNIILFTYKKKKKKSLILLFQSQMMV